MTSVSSARERVLGSVRSGTAGTAKAPEWLGEAYLTLPRNYIRAGKLDQAARVALLVERLREYGAEVEETAPENLPGAIAARLSATGQRRFVVPEDVPEEWLAAGYEWMKDDDLPADEIEHCGGVLTAATCAVADSGTIVLHHGALEGRRLLTLLPDTHVCVLRTSQVVETLPEYFQKCVSPPEFVTWISGPSATADIEMTRIKGVHGPRFLHVVLVGD
jgi:L-lactate dehydrogenase complex protein LldG